MYKKQKHIKDLKSGDAVSDIFIVESKTSVKQYAKGFMFSLKVYDKTGDIQIKFFGPRDKAVADKLYGSIAAKGAAYITGTADDKFSGKMEITINDPTGIRPLAPDEYDPADFVKIGERDIKELEAELASMIMSVENSDLAALLDAMFIKDTEFRALFIKTPASRNRHQNWVGGLLEHTLNVAKIVEFVYCIYPSMDRDLLITSALLHDIGKARELEVGAGISYTVAGELLGHITIGYDMLQKKMETLKTPDELRLKLLHILLSHHGKYEFGSPKLPSIPEAVAINYADDMDAKVADILEAIKNANTQDAFIQHPDFKRIYTK